MKPNKQAFTLIELLVVVLIIGILAAVALPQYQKAVLKSRYSTLMPIATALANSNEVYYLEHGNYAESPNELTISSKETDDVYKDGTQILMYDDTELSYVNVRNLHIPNARYVVYQKYSKNFANTTQCEANNDTGHALCIGLGGKLIKEGSNSTGEADWTAYLLSGVLQDGDDFSIGGNKDNNDDKADSVTCREGDAAPNNMPDIEAKNGANGKASCVNGKWKYVWTNGKTAEYCYGETSAYECAGMTLNRSGFCSGYVENACTGTIFTDSARCFGNAAHACSGTTFSGAESRCRGNSEYACEGATFQGQSGNQGCEGLAENACANSTFQGSSWCSASAANACSGSTFEGKSYCWGFIHEGCAGAIIQPGAHCSPTTAGGCNGALYPADENGNRGCCSGTNCPSGSPKCSYSNGRYTWDGTYW